jgi:Na+-translocating ferredoxin:NAD+ oxidoreductase RnfG subunit
MVLVSRNTIGLAAILVLTLIPDLCAGSSPDMHKKVQKEVDKLFDAETQCNEIGLKTDGQSSSALIREGDRAYALEHSEDLQGYVFSTSAKGRYDYFDYSIIYAMDLSVMGVLVTTYRSSHGAGICSKGWLKQFRGYQGEELRLGKDVDSISGATISATSIVEDMKRCTLLMEELQASGLLNQD